MEVIVHPNILANISDDRKKLLFLIEQFLQIGSHKIAVDKNLLLFDSYTKIAHNDFKIAEFLKLLSYNSNNIVRINTEIYNINNSSLVNLASSSNSKIILSNDIADLSTHFDDLYRKDIRIISWNEIFGEIKNKYEVKSIRNGQGKFIEETGILNKELANYYAKYPNKLKSLSPRNFERLVSDIIKDMGFNTFLTPETRDGGKDIVAEYETPLSKIVCFIECKKYAETNKVGIDVLERFLYNVQIKDNVNLGVIVTTSKFSSEAKKIATNNEYLLKLVDIDKLTEWLNQYGTWSPGKNNLWLRNI